jgi:peptidoglycan hydrolase-like protein with peptidoglycan-binding domain
MKIPSVAPLAHLRTAVIAALLLAVLAMAPAAQAAQAGGRELVAMASAGWHGRAIKNPHPRVRLAHTQWPKGWSAGPVRRGSGYARGGGSRRVREVQRRLTKLGYRPGPVDGLFGPRTEAATRWFQYKHGLRHTGRVAQATLAVLRARSKHKPLPTERRSSAPNTSESPSGEPITPAVATAPPEGAATPAPPEGAATPAPPEGAATPAERDRNTDALIIALILLLLALGAGIVVGMFGLDLFRRRPTPSPAPPARPALPRGPAEVVPPVRPRPAAATPVLGYVVLTEANPTGNGATLPTLEALCARRGWALTKVIHDPEPESGRMTDRQGLIYALKEIRAGEAAGLVIARLRDFARLRDLAVLMQWVSDADGFVAAADRELDTSTRAGQATATAIVELGRWERAAIAERTRHDLTNGRFTPPMRVNHDMGPYLGTMRARGISLRAIADALNLGNVPAPAGQTRWRPTSVQAIAHDRPRKE